MSTNDLATVGQVVNTIQEKTDAVQAFIWHHSLSSHTLKLPFIPAIQLPQFLTVHGLMVIVVAVLMFIMMAFAYRGRRKSVPTGMANLLEVFVAFIRDDIAVPFLGEKDGRAFTPLFCSFFSFILLANLIGLIPCLAPATGNVNVTGALALITFFFMTIGAMIKTGVGGFIKGLIPIPGFMGYVLFPLELFSVIIAAGALMIRLFANMFAGHFVIFSMLGMVFIFGYIALPIISLALFVYFLEVFVAFLQAYIFTLLSSIFIGMRYHPAH